MFARQVTTSKTCWWVQAWARELRPKKKRTPGKLNLQKESVDSMWVKVKITTSLFLWCCNKWPDHRLWTGQLNVFMQEIFMVLERRRNFQIVSQQWPGQIAERKKKCFENTLHCDCQIFESTESGIGDGCWQTSHLINIVKGHAQKQAAVSCTAEAVETVLRFFSFFAAIKKNYDATITFQVSSKSLYHLQTEICFTAL